MLNDIPDNMLECMLSGMSVMVLLLPRDDGDAVRL